MKLFLNASIKNKLRIIILLSTTIIIGIAFIFDSIDDINTYKNEMVNNTFLNARLIGEFCVTPLSFRDDKVTREVIAKTEAIPSILTCCIYDEDNILFASYQKIKDLHIPKNVPVEMEYSFKNSELRIFLPIKYKGVKYGTVYIKSSTDLLNEKINQQLTITAILFLVLLIISFFIASKLQETISKPILTLANTTSKITSEKNYSISVQKSGSDEIGLLYDSFNKMLIELSKHEEERNRTEQLIRNSEAKYRNIIDTSHDGIWGVDTDSKTTFVNKRMAEILGYSVEEMNNMLITEFMYAEDIPSHFRKVNNRRKGIGENYERRFCHKNGKTVWTLVSASPIFDDKENFQGSFAMFTDITERKLNEEKIRLFNEEEKIRNEELIEKNNELKKARKATLNIIEDLSKEIDERKKAEQRIAQLAAIVEFSDDAVIGKNLDGIITSWNKGAETIYGYNESEIIGKHIFTIVPEYLRNEIQIILNKIKREQHIEHFETIRQKKNGGLIYVSLTISPVLDRDRKVIGASTIGRDITENKKAEEALQKSEEKYRTLIQKIQAAVVVHNSDTEIITCNPSAEKLLGLSQSQLMGRTAIDPLWHFFREDGTIMPNEEYPANLVVAGKQVIRNYIVGVFRPGNENIWALVNADPVFGSNNEIVEIIVTFFDITELKHLEKERAQMNRALRMLSDSNQALIHITDETSLLKEVCNVVVSGGGYRFSWVGLSDQNNKGNMTVAANAGTSEIINPLKLDWNSDKNIFGKALSTGIYQIHDLNVTPLSSELNINNSGDYKSIISLPLIDNNQILGELNIYSDKEHAFDPKEVEILVELSGDLAFGIHTLRTKAQKEEAEKALFENEQKLRTVFNTIEEALSLNEIVYDENDDIIDYRVLEVNPAFEKDTGLSHNEVVGKKATELYGENSEFIKNFWRSNTQIDHPLISELYLEQSDVWKHVITSKPVGGKFVISYFDITERRLAEIELRRLNLAIEQSPVSVVITNVAGEIDYVNPKFTEVTGYTPDEVLGKNPRILKSGETDPIIYKQLWKSITSGFQWRGEFHNKKKNGELFWETASVSPVRNEKGDIINFVAIKEDISDRKRSEKALKESEEQYRSLVTTVPDIIIRTDLNEKIIFINESILKLYTNIPVKQIIGKNIYNFISPLDKQRAIEDSKLLLEQQTGLKEYKVMFDREIDCEVNGNMLRDSDGKPYGMVFILRDITARKQAEKELEKYRLHLEELIAERTKKLEEVNKLLQEEILKQKEAEEKVKQALVKEKELSELKTRFISIASHEFRTPLATIFSSAELLEMFGLQWELEKYKMQINRIKNNVLGLTEIMDDVLAISRADAGKIKFSPVKTNLETLCLSVMEDARLLLTKEHSMNFNYMLKNKLFNLDEKLIRLVLMNLLSNAIKYSVNDGNIDFTVLHEKDSIIFKICDNGIGIPEPDLLHLFDSFHRGSNVGKIHGTGLGLSIAKRYIEMHNGTIECSSKVGIGSTFTIRIPSDINL